MAVSHSSVENCLVIKEIATTAIQQRQGAWIILRAISTGRLLIARRSKYVNNMKTWNFFGGGVDEGETFITAARREMFEESGLRLRGRLQPLLEYKDLDKHNRYYLLDIPEEVEPTLNKEHDKWKWVELKELPALTFNPPTARFFKLYDFKRLKLGRQPTKVRVEK